jgi:hypothetical protein
MITSDQIIIHVGTFNRKSITNFCLRQLKKYKQDALLYVHDDDSREYDSDWIDQFADIVTLTGELRTKDSNVLRNTRVVFASFKYIQELVKTEEYSHIKYIYHCDNDIVHDKNFMNMLLYYYNKYNLPVSLFIHKYLVNLEELEDGYRSEHLPGASILFPISFVDRIDLNFAGSWDTYCNPIFGGNFIFSKNSYAEHYDFYGVHSYIGSNFCINPTKYLMRIDPYIKRKIL